MLLPEQPCLEQVLGIAERLQASLRAPIVLGQEQIYVHASIGIALYRSTAATARCCCAAPTRRCTWPSARGAGRRWCSSRTSTTPRASACSCSPTCIRPWHCISSPCTTSRS
ncbi:hypothetical protein I0E98_01075 [Pseudomonas lalucatii]|nr:hypothetical protein [Pseudomonas lalucatii]